MLSIQCLEYLQSGVLGLNKLTLEEKARYKNACKCDDDPECRCNRADPTIFNYQDARLQYPFLEYAVTNWAHHVSRYNMEDKEFFQSIDRFANPKSATFRRWVALEWTTGKAWTEVPSTLHIAAFAGLIDCTKTLLLEGKSVDSLDAACRTPLQ